MSCPTKFASTPPSTTAPLPTSEEVSIPATLASELAVYSDTHGLMMLLGPKDWSCEAEYGEDGSGGVVIYPSGESVPQSWGAGWQLPASSTTEAIIGSQTSACQGCGAGQACRLFATAASDFQSDIGQPCPIRPASESVQPIGAGVVGFLDPPDVTGDGDPSGGLYPANGVMTYYSPNVDGSWVETCTLPGSQHALCTAALNAFVASYGNL